MKKKPQSQPIERRLSGHVEIRNGQAIFVPNILIPRPRKKILEVPYYSTY